MNNLTDLDALIRKLEVIIESSKDSEIDALLGSRSVLSEKHRKSLNVAIAIRKKRLERAFELFDQLEEDKYSFTYMLLKGIIDDLKQQDERAVQSFIRAMILSPKKDFRDVLLNFYGAKYEELERVNEFVEKVKSHQLKILHGTMEIANQMYTYVSGLKKLGAFARSVNYYPTYMKHKNDFVVPIQLVDDKTINQFITNFDIFHFHFATSLHPKNADLPFLRKIGKTVVMHYWGSDVRTRTKALELNPYAKVKEENEEGLIQRLKFISEHVPHCVTEWTLREYVVDYHRYVHFLPQAVDLKRFPFSPKMPGDKIVIVHAPTDREFKGTATIVEAVEALSSKFPIEFVLVEGKSHQEARRIYIEADLVIDQIHSEGYGLFAIESMALGKPVIVSVADFFVPKYPKELPVIRVNPNNLKDVLEMVLAEPEKLPEVGTSGRKYVERYHDIEKIKFDLLEMYYVVLKEDGKV